MEVGWWARRGGRKCAAKYSVNTVVQERRRKTGLAAFVKCPIRGYLIRAMKLDLDVVHVPSIWVWQVCGVQKAKVNRFGVRIEGSGFHARLVSSFAVVRQEQAIAEHTKQQVNALVLAAVQGGPV